MSLLIWLVLLMDPIYMSDFPLETGVSKALSEPDSDPALK